MNPGPFFSQLASEAALHAPPRNQRPICLITHEFYPKRGGIATFAEEIARAATLIGHNIEVWAQTAGAAKEKRWPFPLRRLPIRGTHDMGCWAWLALELIRKRRKLRHSIVYMPEPGPLLAMMSLQFFSAFRPKRLVVTFHGSEILRFHANPAQRVLLRQLIRNTWRISTLTEYTRDLLCEYFPEARDKIILTPGAVRSDLAPDGNGAPTSAPLAFDALPSAEPGKHVVLTVGRIHPRKGQMHTLRALQALPRDLRARTEYWIAGKTNGSSYEKKLRELAAANTGLIVRFLGEIPDRALGPVYERAHVFAMTSVNYRQSVEGFGLVYLEASAHGLPVVAHRVGGVSEAVLDGKTGIVVAPPFGDGNDVNPQLIAAFEKILGDESLRTRMGAAGRSHAHSNSWIEAAKKLFSTDDAIINGAGHFSPTS